MIAAFRGAMVGVYLNAAKAREQGKATRGQLTNAKSALARLTEAARSLATSSAAHKHSNRPSLLRRKRELNAASAASDSEHLSIPSHLGGYPREENPLRPMSRLIDVMRAKQSFMGALGNF
jgi:hypothetical protein